MNTLEQDIKEIKEKIDRICHALGIGRVPPATVIDIKRYVEKKTEEMNKKNFRKVEKKEV